VGDVATKDEIAEATASPGRIVVQEGRGLQLEVQATLSAGRVDLGSVSALTKVGDLAVLSLDPPMGFQADGTPEIESAL
jgi:hypothetical protein